MLWNNFQSNSNLCDHSTSMSRTNGQMTCHGNTALYIVSRGKNEKRGYVYPSIKHKIELGCEKCRVNICSKQVGLLSPAIDTSSISEIFQQAPLTEHCLFVFDSHNAGTFIFQCIVQREHGYTDGVYVHHPG